MLTSKKIQVVKNNKRPRLTGEKRYGAVLSDHEVELLRQMHEEFPRGHPKHLGQRKLARLFGVSRTCVNNYVNYRKRVSHL